MIDINNFTAEEIIKLEEIRERVRVERHYSRIRKIEQENIKLRRMLLEAITCMIHGRKPNDEFMQEINAILRLEKFNT